MACHAERLLHPNKLTKLSLTFSQVVASIQDSEHGHNIDLALHKSGVTGKACCATEKENWSQSG